MITSAPPGALTQGTIFSCAVAEDYDGCGVHGLVITARCDITNDKAEVFNYVPVVPFDDWLEREAVRFLASRISRTAMGELKNTLQQLNLAPAILNTTTPREVLRVIFDAEDAPTKVKQRREIFNRQCQRFEIATACAGSFHRDVALRFLESERAEAGKLIKDLCQNAIAEAYYLPSVEPGQDCPGYVVLLREIRHIPRALAATIARGLDEEGYKELCNAHPRCADRLSIPADGFAWPTGLVQSPFIEHLMQRFTLLFSRIGVTDVSRETVSRLQGRLPALREE